MFHNQIQCSIIKSFTVPSPFTIPDPPLRLFPTTSVVHPQLSLTPTSLTHSLPILDYSVHPPDHPVVPKVPHLTIRLPHIAIRCSPILNEIPLQLSSALHCPLLQKSIALNASIILGNLLLGILHVLLRFLGHLMRWISLPKN